MLTLDEIEQHTIPFDQFQYKWRFTHEKYNLLPTSHLEQIRPLDKVASRLVWDVTVRHEMFDRGSLSRTYFRQLEAIALPQALEGEQSIKEWLYQRRLPFAQQVYVSWDNNSAAITTWKMIVKYWSDFWYPGSDDLVVVDKTLSWALVFYHHDYVEFGTNRKLAQETCENELIGTVTF